MAQDSKLQRRVQRFLAKNNIEARSGDDVERLRLLPFVEATKRPDFYIPCTKLYVEVKGLMTYAEVYKVAALANRKDINFYLYQASDRDYRPWKDDWEHDGLTEAQLSAVEEIEACARQAECKKRGSGTQQAAYKRARQQGELLLLATDASLASAANMITRKRLTRYVQDFMADFEWLGFYKSL